MNLRRISLAIPDTECLRVPRPGGSGVSVKTLSMFNRSQMTYGPLRLTPKPSTSAKATLKTGVASVKNFKPTNNHAAQGPSRQLIPSSPTRTSDILDGISVLPPSSCTRNRVLKSNSKKTKVIKDSAQMTSRIPCRSAGNASGKSSREKLTFTVKRRAPLTRSVQKNKVAAHPRLQAITHQSTPPSSRSADSIDQFEADELAAALPTPARSYQQRKTCQSNCSETLQEMQKVQQEIIMSHKQFLVKQTEHLQKQNKLIEKQTEVLCKLHSLLDKNINFFSSHLVTNDNHLNGGKENRKLRPKRRHTVKKHSVSNEDDSSDDEIKPKRGRSKKSQIRDRAESHYNEIRSEFGCLSLKTPKKDGGLTLTPKTPKSILSRTLQMQLGDIFEES